MQDIKVLGSGCAKCEKTASLIEKLAQEQGASVTVEKETRPEALITYGVMRTPAVVIDGQLVHSGGIPDASTVITWFKPA